MVLRSGVMNNLNIDLMLGSSISLVNICIRFGTGFKNGFFFGGFNRLRRYRTIAVSLVALPTPSFTRVPLGTEVTKLNLLLRLGLRG